MPRRTSSSAFIFAVCFRCQCPFHTFWMVVAATWGSIFGGPRSWASLSLSSCILDRDRGGELTGRGTQVKDSP